MPVSIFRSLDAQDMPLVFLPISRTRLRQSMERDFLDENPNIDLTVPQPASSMLDVGASYLKNAGTLQSNLLGQSFIRFAVGRSLDEIGRERGIPRNPGEIDDNYRNRLETAPYRNTATFLGLEGAALRDDTLSPKLRAISFTYNPTTGITTTHPLASDADDDPTADRGTPPAALLTEVTTFLSQSTVGVLGSQFTSVAPTITKWYMQISVTLDRGQTLSDIQTRVVASLEAFINSTYTLGNRITQQDLYRVLSASSPGTVFTITRLNTVGAADTGLGDLQAANEQTALLGIASGVDATITVVETTP